MRLVLTFMLLTLSINSLATTYTGKVKIIQSGYKNTIQLQSDTYALITLDPLPAISEACASDQARRIILDAGTQWGKTMFAQLLAAQAASKTVLLGISGCATQTGSNNAWALVDWMRSF